MLSCELGGSPASLSPRSVWWDPEGIVGLSLLIHRELARTKTRVPGLAAHAFWEVAPPSKGSDLAWLGLTSGPSQGPGYGLAPEWRGVDSGGYCGTKAADVSAHVPPAAHWSSSGQMAPPLGRHGRG